VLSARLRSVLLLALCGRSGWRRADGAVLARAGAAGAAVGGGTVERGASAARPPSVEQVWDRLHLATAPAVPRAGARRAAIWAGAAGLASSTGAC